MFRKSIYIPVVSQDSMGDLNGRIENGTLINLNKSVLISLLNEFHNILHIIFH